MDIDKLELKNLLFKKEYEKAFKIIDQIASYVARNRFTLENEEEYRDAVQTAQESNWNKVIQNKYNPQSDNPYGFFYKNSCFAISDMVRKNNNRKNILRNKLGINKFISYETLVNV